MTYTFRLLKLFVFMKRDSMNQRPTAILVLVCVSITIIFTDPQFLFSLIHVMVEKILFLGQIFEMEILVDLQVMKSPESENHICSVWFVCMCVCH